MRGRRVVTDAQLDRMQVASQRGDVYYADCSDAVLFVHIACSERIPFLRKPVCIEDPAVILCQVCEPRVRR